MLDVILRKTYGWNKKEDKISLSQFRESTGLSSVHLIRARNKLIEMNIIVVTQKGNRAVPTYRLQKNYDKWKLLPKKVTAMGKDRININEIKAKIRKRDDNCCQLCGYDGNLSTEVLPVHHVNFNQGNHNETNLITLCKSCHAKSHTVTQKEKLSKKIITITQKGNSVTQKGNKPLPKKVHTKERRKETITKETSLSKKDFHPDDIRLTQLLIDLIQKNDIRSGVGELTEKQQENWINSCRLLREKNKRTAEEIEGVIRWCQQDDFWMPNILSMPTLRKRFDRLYLKARQSFESDGFNDWLNDPEMGR